MSTVAASSDKHDHGHGLPFLAHHFDTPEQQFASAKLGMWVFLGTEILMFGGLFCAYAVYRHNHPEIFLFAAEKYLSTFWGAFNTCILIASSFTMAWAVRLVQINKIQPAVICLILTFLGGVGFMVIKGVEYEHKWKDHVFPGSENKYSKAYGGDPTEKFKAQEAHGTIGAMEDAAGDPHAAAAVKATESQHAAQAELSSRAPVVMRPGDYIDPNANTPDAAKIVPNFNQLPGLAPDQMHGTHIPEYTDLRKRDQETVATFFSIYFVMTGLHGLHVLVGMALIAWVTLKTLGGNFGTVYYTPVEIVGLYWHLVDLIWIFLFPLLYLIH
jgi:cytochrome c oxidase subunit 3